MTDEPLTYADTGVDIDASAAATAALTAQLDDIDTTAYAGLIDTGDTYLALTTDGVGTKLLVADTMADYSTVGIDCIAMNVNDLVARGIQPLAFVDYLAMDHPDPDLTAQIGEGLARGAADAGVALVGGETAIMPEVITGVDLAGACVGVAPKPAVFDGQAQPGDAIVGWPSAGIHSNGLTLARRAVTREHAYTDPLPGTSQTIGEALLTPTRLYTGLLEALREHHVTAAAHITGGGWTNLARLGDHHYRITDPHPAHPVFDLIQTSGRVTDVEMHRTFNMGTGFVATLPPDRADALAAATDDPRIIGSVEPGTGITIRDLELRTEPVPE